MGCVVVSTVSLVKLGVSKFGEMIVPFVPLKWPPQATTFRFDHKGEDALMVAILEQNVLNHIIL